MAKELGIGVRVWVGWCPDDEVASVFDGRAKTGTISGGPWRPGDLVEDGQTGALVIIRGNELLWNVDLDDGGHVSARERLLFPIDDGDPAAEPERADRPEEVEA